MGPDLLPAVPRPFVHAGECFFEFFTANIWNTNTRQAYARAVSHFFDWYEARGYRLQDLCRATSPAISSCTPRPNPR